MQAMATLKLGTLPRVGAKVSGKCGSLKGANNLKVLSGGGNGDFPSFLPTEVENIKDPFARALAKRIQRLPVQIGFSEECIMSSCVKPMMLRKTSPVVLLHSFDSSCLEWRCAYPLLEEAGLEVWAIDILGWGFSDLEIHPPCDVPSKRYHLYQLWKSYIKRPMILVGPSLGASAAIDFTVHYPEAVEKLVLINPSVYAEGTGNLAKLPQVVAYAGVSLLKSLPLRLYANMLAFNGVSFSTVVDWTNVNQKTLIIYSEHDQIVNCKLAVKLQCELPNAIIRQVADSGHLPHVDKPDLVANLIRDFAQRDQDSELVRPIKRKNMHLGSNANRIY